MTKDCIILNKKKKILIVTPDFQLGGTNTSLENLLNQISIDNYDYLVDILALSSFGYLKPRFIYYNVIKTNKILNLKIIKEPGVVAHAFNPSTREAEAGGFLSSRPAWSTE